MFVAWTTVDDPSVAARLALEAVNERLAACVQVDDMPIVSTYLWEDKIQTSREYRIAFKCLPEQLGRLETWVHQHHPYAIPEWIVVRAEHVAEKYLSWAKANSTFPPL